MIIQPGGGYTTAGVGLAKWLELTTNTVAQCVRQQNSSIHTTINNSREFTGFLFTGNQRKQEKQLTGIFSAGAGKVQMYRTSQSHNDDVTNVNGQLPDD